MMNQCPCCSHQLLRHINRSGIYWFCASCWQEMPLLDRDISVKPYKAIDNR